MYQKLVTFQISEEKKFTANVLGLNAVWGILFLLLAWPLKNAIS